MDPTQDITDALGAAYSKTAKNGQRKLNHEALKAAVKELVAEGTILTPSPDGIAWAEIGLSAMHPLRRRILQHLGEVEKASPNELAKLFGEGLSQVSYHVKQLFEPDNPKNPSLIEAAGTTPRRGAVEHYYRRREEPVYEKTDRRRKRPRSKASVGV